MSLKNVIFEGEPLPEYAKCYCVSKHTPMYSFPIPFQVPDGQLLYLCPNSHHSVTTLWGLYRKMGGQPPREVVISFSYFAQRLAKLCFQIEQEDRAALEALKDEVGVIHEP